MSSRSSLPDKQRHASSQLAQIAHDKSFIVGGIVRMARVCGVSGCKCTRGRKHVSSYLSLKYKNKRRMIYVPRELEDYAKDCLKNYHDIKALMDVISGSCVERFFDARKKRLS